MPSTFYDPEIAPDPQEWLALSEVERIRLARSYHQAARIKLPNVKLHAAIHAAVENQIATGYGPTCRAMARLQEQGLTRHEATHAVGTVIAQFVHELSTPGPEPKMDFNQRMNAAIEALSASEWRTDGGTGNEV